MPKRGIIRKSMAVNGINGLKHLAKQIGICQNTLYQKMECLDKFRRNELSHMSEVLKLTEDEKVILIL